MKYLKGHLYSRKDVTPMFNLFKSKKEAACDIEETASNANDSVAASKQNAASQDDKLALLQHNQRCIVDKIKEKVNETDFAAENLIVVTNEIVHNVENQMLSIDKVVTEISTYSAIAEEVIASTENSKSLAETTLSTAKEGSNAVKNSLTAMEEIKGSVDNVKDVVLDLNKKSSQINEMLQIIKEISNQTNLLSLNAAIEAARAGEAGRGFAVVAAEVKQLAQRTVESAEHISEIIAQINGSIEQTMIAMNKSTEKVSEGTSIANNTMEVFENIIDAVNTTTRVTAEISAAASKQTLSLETIVASAQDMNMISEKVMAMVEWASLNSKYTKTSVDALSEVAENLKRVSDNLLNNMAKVQKSETVVRTAMKGSPLTNDPHMTFDHMGGQVLSNVHRGLLQMSSNGEISPAVAKTWYVEEDNMTWFFILRKGAKFHSGREVTAEDVKESFERLLSPVTKAPNAWFLENLEGSDEFMNGTAREIKGLTVVDKYRLKLKLKSPYSGFLLNLSRYCCAIMDKVDLKENKFTGCGPFQIEQMNKEGCTLASFKDYFGGQPYVDKIVIDFEVADVVERFMDGKYDFIDIDSFEEFGKLKSNGYSNFSIRNAFSSAYAGLNLKSSSPLIQDVEIRRAMNYGINKQRIIKELVGGLATESTGPMPPEMINNAKMTAYDYNPSKAKEILRRKGITSGTLKVNVKEEEVESIDTKITKCIMADFEQLGIKCVLNKVPRTEYHKTERIKQCDLFVSRWMADTGDPDNFLQPLFNPANVSDFTGYDCEETTELMVKARQIVNPEKRVKFYEKIQQKIVEDAPWIFLFHPQRGYVTKKEIMGVKLGNLGLISYEDIMVDNA